MHDLWHNHRLFLRMVLVIGQNSTWQKTCLLPQLERGEVNRIDRVMFGASGKGANVARGLKLLAKKPHLLGYTGGINGDRFKSACKSEGLEGSFIPLEDETRICTTIIEASGRTTELIEPSPIVSDQARAAFKQKVQEKIPAAALLAITGTALPAEPDECYKDYLIQAKSHNVPVLLDSYRRHGARALEAAPEILNRSKIVTQFFRKHNGSNSGKNLLMPIDRTPRIIFPKTI